MFIKQVLLSFTALLPTKWICLNNELFLARHNLIDLKAYELSQGLHHYPPIVSLDKCNRCCNTLDE